MKYSLDKKERSTNMPNIEQIYIYAMIITYNHIYKCVTSVWICQQSGESAHVCVCVVWEIQENLKTNRLTHLTISVSKRSNSHAPRCHSKANINFIIKTKPHKREDLGRSLN